MNRWSCKKEAVQEIGGSSRLAVKGLYCERMGNRSSKQKVEKGASAVGYNEFFFDFFKEKLKTQTL